MIMTVRVSHLSEPTSKDREMLWRSRTSGGPSISSAR
jgi:hypothetical protein